MAELSRKYCVNCLADVSNLRLRCTDCADIELCPECFCAGAEIGAHRRWHGYQQVDGGRFTLWGPEAEGGWTGREEQSLLDAIEQYGFGNWEDMAAHVGASRTPQEVMEHYVSMYIHGNLGKACIPESIPNRVTDHTCPAGAPLSPSLTAPPPPPELSADEQHRLGYMPLRDDYEVEYEQEAELLVSGLSVNYDDDDVELEMKRAHVDMYVRRLRERQRRKDVARDYGLVPAFLGKERKDKGGAAASPAAAGPAPSASAAAPTPPPPAKRKAAKEEREQRARLRALCRFTAQRDFEDLFEGAQRERALRARVRELQRCRRNGVTRLDESAEYEAARHKRERRKENKTSSKRGGGAGGAAPGGGALREDGKDGEFGAMEHLAGFELLSERERALCGSLGLSPGRYLTAKTLVVRDHLQRRQGAPAKSRLPGYLDRILKRRILNFLTESGWISRDAA